MGSSQGDEALAVEFGLEHEFMLPLASGKLDPFIGIVGALAELQPGELGLFQVLFQPVQNPWAESIVNSVTHADGKPFFVDSPELADAAENKIARPLFAAVVRILIRAEEFDRIVATGPRPCRITARIRPSRTATNSSRFKTTITLSKNTLKTCCGGRPGAPECYLTATN